MNINDLNKIDIKDINLEKIQNTILQNPLNAIKGLMILLALFASFKILNGKMTENSQNNTKILELEKKLKVIASHDAKQKEQKEFIANLKSGMETEPLIDFLSDLATETEVKILNFSPADKINKPHFSKINLKLSFTGTSYPQILRFINKIEQAPENLLVKFWRATMDTPPDPAPGEKIPESIISGQLEVETINFKKIP